MTNDVGADRLAELARALADPTRAAFCLALLDGRAWTAGELARRAGVAASTATEHLHRLTAVGVLAERRQGRHRYVELADARVAALIEDMAALLPPVPAPVTGLRSAAASTALARGRTCYDHLAGRLGVALTEAMGAHGYLETEGGFALSREGRRWMEASLGVDTAAWGRRRPVARACLDWTERRTHLAGQAGASLCRALSDRGWTRGVGSTRAVRLTDDGRDALQALLDIDASERGLL
ncbi:winged helix-turn-helix domain-containing protein [Glycomyces sp. YM15]|uniref:ArsR/SmtB family transcription factor n=1 Tax=Glycomyces sp. YM15 TaxID=2800446 RepID=UPI0027DC9392|nr:winged helix-turn-helix domain-containing protein [Glycomyces sp. YM15]